MWLYLLSTQIRSNNYLHTLNIQKNKEKHLRMHNNDFDIFLRSAQYSAKLQIAKTNKTLK